MATLPLADPWTEAMLRGDFEAAWRVCDRVLAARRGRDCSHWPRHLQYIWDGSTLEGRHVLVRCYHGLGDTLQFARLLAPLRERARRVTLWVQPALIDLLQDVRGVDQLLPLHDGAPAVDYDVDIEVMELAHALRLSLDDLPGPMPYLMTADSPRGARGADDSGSLHVGLCWRGGDWDCSRSLAQEHLGELLQTRGVRWHSLQFPPEAPPGWVQLGCRDLVKLAARLRTLDLVITVDTMTAHLAGALGLPVWTLLAHECDWRWMRDRADSPWYPTMRLFRQERPGDWSAVVAAVTDAMSNELRAASQKRRAGGAAVV